MLRRHFLHHAFWLGVAAPVLASPEPDWPLWRAFVARFMQADGRVIDHAAGGRSTSEGQAYAMFFALVANDRERFGQLLAWTERHLAGGDLRQQLPAWLWGRNLLGRWQVLDANSASDADLWLAYALLEAGRLWGEPAYSELGLAVLARVARLSVVQLPGFGRMLLPAPRGFSYSGRRWRLNPSYLVPQQLRRFAAVDLQGPWAGMDASMPVLMKSVAPLGLVPDWAIYSAGDGWLPDGESKSVASYDAVRTYLWTGMVADGDPRRGSLLDAQHGLRSRIAADGQFPERIGTRTGEASGSAPIGFSAALLPWLSALGDRDALAVQQRRLAAAKSGELYGTAHGYYDQVLALFGLGWFDRRYRFDPQGSVVPRWAE